MENSNHSTLTKRDVAGLLGCSVRQVDILRANGGLPFYRFGNLVRFSRESVLEWMKAQERVGGCCASLVRQDGETSASAGNTQRAGEVEA